MTAPASENKPISDENKPTVCDATRRHATAPPPMNATECNIASPIASEPDGLRPTRAIDETNPPPSPAHRHRSLTPRQLAAVRLLAQGCPVGIAAERIGICRQTLSRWQQDPRFLAELDAAHITLLGGCVVPPPVVDCAPVRPAAMESTTGDSDRRFAERVDRLMQRIRR
jgi:hypothetical protein